MPAADSAALSAFMMSVLFVGFFVLFGAVGVGVCFSVLFYKFVWGLLCCNLTSCVLEILVYYLTIPLFQKSVLFLN